MGNSWRFQRFKKLDLWLRNCLPIITPWFLVPMGFEIFAAFLQGCADNSLQDVLLFVVLPVSGGIMLSHYCGSIIFGPTTAPSSVAALITTMARTYFVNISSAMSQTYNATFCVLSLFLGFMFWRMIKSNPGRLIPDIIPASIPPHQDRSCDLELQSVVPRGLYYDDSVRVLASSSMERNPLLRQKHCRYCNVQVERYDHHCPAIYNCVGRKNHVLFLLMMVNFIVVEALYVGASKVYLDPKVESWTWSMAIDEIMGQKLRVLGTALFAFFHILWQVPFLAFHVYCACVNLTTDEMFHWESYSDLYVERPPGPGRPHGGKEFFNPYCNGIKNNLTSFLQS